MPNFDVTIRRDQYDVDGLVLACKVEDATPALWTNTAPAVQPGSSDPRFLDLIQTVTANQPTIVNLSGQDYVYFKRTDSKYYELLVNAGTWSGINEWTVAISGKKGADSSNNQYLFSIPNMELIRRNAAGNKAYIYNVTEVPGTGDVADGAYLMIFQGVTGGAWFENGVFDFSGGCADITPGVAGEIGRRYTAANYADFYMTGVYVWKRVLQIDEIDFVFDHIDPVTKHAVFDWAIVTLKDWLDDTATPPRINPYSGASHKYYHVAIPSGTTPWIQITASVGGLVLPDSKLGGKLFTPSWTEVPSVKPLTYSPSSWSSIIELKIEDEGHYTLQITREDGGSVIVHFDAEVI